MLYSLWIYHPSSKSMMTTLWRKKTMYRKKNIFRSITKKLFFLSLSLSLTIILGCYTSILYITTRVTVACCCSFITVMYSKKGESLRVERWSLFVFHYIGGGRCCYLGGLCHSRRRRWLPMKMRLCRRRRRRWMLLIGFSKKKSRQTIQYTYISFLLFTSSPFIDTRTQHAHTR